MLRNPPADQHTHRQTHTHTQTRRHADAHTHAHVVVVLNKGIFFSCASRDHRFEPQTQRKHANHCLRTHASCLEVLVWTKRLHGRKDGCFRATSAYLAEMIQSDIFCSGVGACQPVPCTAAGTRSTRFAFITEVIETEMEESGGERENSKRAMMIYLSQTGQLRPKLLLI